MAEWSIAAVLKTVELRGSGGSNPSLSAKKRIITEVVMKITTFFIVIRRVLANTFADTLLIVINSGNPLLRNNPLWVLRSTGMGDRREPIPLSALNSLQGVNFQPCRLFLCTKSCTKNAPTPFLRTSTGVFQIAHIQYILSYFLALPSIQYNISSYDSRHSVRHYGGCFFDICEIIIIFVG